MCYLIIRYIKELNAFLKETKTFIIFVILYLLSGYFICELNKTINEKICEHFQFKIDGVFNLCELVRNIY